MVSIVFGALVLMAALTAITPQTPHVSGGPGTRAIEATLTSAQVTIAPIIDGDGTDTAWSRATQIMVTVSGGANMVGDVDVHVKSVYVGNMVYFWAHWADTEESKDRFPWFYNTTDGKWEQRGDTTSHDENTYYEDKLAMIWDIGGSITGFNSTGPTVTCHITPSLLHYTNGPSEMADMWHWKRVRTDPIGQMDDQYMDDNSTAASGGRHSDPKTSGGYSSNIRTLNYTDDPANSTQVPAAWVPGGTGDDLYWIKKTDLGVRAYNITGVWKSNGTLMDEMGNILENPDETTHLPGIQIQAMTGDRGDITAKGQWASSFWTLEFSRLLVTGSQYDVQFSDTGPTAKYYFGLGIFNNAQVDHGFHSSSVFEFIFEQPNQNPGTPTINADPNPAKIDETVTFTASATDPDGDTLTYTWEFGDGTTGTGTSTTHSYGSTGTYMVNVTASDGKGGTSTASVTVTVEEAPAPSGISTEMLIIIVVIIIIMILIIAMARRKKPEPPIEPPMSEP